MATAVITGLIANMLWVDNGLSMDEIKHHLKGYHHSYSVQLDHYPQCQPNGCHLVHWNCDSYNVELLAYDISTVDASTNESLPLYTDIDFGIDLDFYSTDYPTMDPTSNPTLTPTLIPTFNPSNPPTANPSVGPSMEPSIDPTQNPSLKPTLYPTTGPSSNPTKGNSMELCCNAMLNKHIGICKPKNGENDCIANKKCYWDESRCLDEPCSGRNSRCKSNDECCSNVCVRFRGISHCT